jgi:Flp pilus assembly protein TadG
MRTRRIFGSERGSALLETALTLPLLLLVSVSIFEFGRAYQTWEVLTNAAREGARVAVLPGSVNSTVEARVRDYMASGALANRDAATVAVTNTLVDIGGGGTASASRVTVTYPFEFMVLQPVAQLVSSGTTLGSAFSMTAVAEMRNETQ